jgi:multidrug resistance efflux pump
MKRLPLLIVLLAVSSILLAACGQNPAPETTVLAAAEPDLLIAQGRLLPRNSMDQSFSIPGQVAEVLVADGDPVRAGQVLARLASSPEAQSALARAQQELLSAQQALESLKTTAETNLAQARLAQLAANDVLEKAQERFDEEDTDENQARLDKAAADLALAEISLKKMQSGAGIDPDQQAAAEARLASAQAALVSAQAAISALELVSTIDGTVVDLTLQAGQRVAAGAPMMTIADFSTWTMKTDNLTEDEVVDVQVGQKAIVTLDALPSNPLNGEVTHINARYEEKRGDITYTVTLVLNQADPRMRWGMTAAVEFVP